MGGLWSSEDSTGTEYAVERRLPNITINITAPPETVIKSIDVLTKRRAAIEKLLEEAIALQEANPPDADDAKPQLQENDFVPELKARLTSLDSDILVLRRMKLEAQAAEIISGKKDKTAQTQETPGQKSRKPAK